MNVFAIVQIVLSLILITVIILQRRGSEAGIAFGGGGESFSSKRGLEKFLFYATIIVAVLFTANSILTLVLQ